LLAVREKPWKLLTWYSPALAVRQCSLVLAGRQFSLVLAV
jgi:hypothetical protein